MPENTQIPRRSPIDFAHPRRMIDPQPTGRLAAHTGLSGMYTQVIRLFCREVLGIKDEKVLEQIVMSEDDKGELTLKMSVLSEEDASRLTALLIEAGNEEAVIEHSTNQIKFCGETAAKDVVASLNAVADEHSLEIQMRRVISDIQRAQYSGVHGRTQ